MLDAVITPWVDWFTRSCDLIFQPCLYSKVVGFPSWAWDSWGVF